MAWLRALGAAALGFVVAGATVWATLAIYYSNLPGEFLRSGWVRLLLEVELDSKADRRLAATARHRALVPACISPARPR